MKNKWIKPIALSFVALTAFLGINMTQTESVATPIADLSMVEVGAIDGMGEMKLASSFIFGGGGHRGFFGHRGHILGDAWVVQWIVV